MKLYIQDNEILFDYSDVDPNADLDYAASDYRKFLIESGCHWETTLKPKVKRMVFEPWEWATEYGNLRELKRLVSKCCYVASRLSSIEISAEDFRQYINELEEKCNELRKAEEAKENERKAKERWAEVCKYGCGRCANKQHWGDDFMCSASGDFLPDKEAPCSYGKVYYPFHREAFPTDNCPFNVNKNKESA